MATEGSNINGTVNKGSVTMILPFLKGDCQGCTGRCQMGCNVPWMRSEVDVVAQETGCNVRLALPCGVGFEVQNPRVAITINGDGVRVMEARSYLVKSRRMKCRNVASTTNSPNSLMLMKMSLDNDNDDEDGFVGLLTPPLSSCDDDMEFIKGDKFVVEEARIKGLQNLDESSGIHTASVRVPLGVAGAIAGYGGRNLARRLLEEGLEITIVGRLSEDGSEYCQVYASCSDSLALENFVTETRSTVNTGHCIKVNLEVGIADWLLTFQSDSLEKILQKYATSLVFTLDGQTLSIHGCDKECMGRTLEEVTKIVYEYQSVDLWVDKSKNEKLPRVELLERMCQVSGAEILYNVEKGLVRIKGTRREVDFALCCGQEHGLPVMQWKYKLRQSAHIRDFVSGKKDGKVIKIMRDTGTSISLLPNSVDEHDIDIEMVAHSLNSLQEALGMLIGEFPAEISFYLDESHHKRLIGHGGKTIQRVMKKHAVYIKFMGYVDSAREYGEAMVKAMPRGLAEGLPNVVMRTPAKNSVSLEGAKEDIFDMAGDFEKVREVRVMRVDRNALLRMKKVAREEVKRQMSYFKDILDLSILETTDGCQDSNDSTLSLQVSGTYKDVEQFTQYVTPLLNEYKSYAGSPMMPGSPISITSNKSNGSATSWTSDSPSLFRHFNMSILTVPTDNLLISGSPVLGMDLSPVLKPCSIAIGGERRKSRRSSIKDAHLFPHKTEAYLKTIDM